MQTDFDALKHMDATILVELGAQPGSVQLRGDRVPPLADGHIDLLKSIKFIKSTGCFPADGSLHLCHLQTYGPTDFARGGSLYFTPQPWVARHRSRLINDACPVADRRTMEVHVPTAHFEAVKTWYLIPEDADLKRLVFFSRCGGSYPKDLSEERRKYGVTHGPIAYASDRAFEKMRDWTDVKGKYMLQDEGLGRTEVVKQYAWVKEEAIEQLADDCVRKLYIRQRERHLRW